MTIQALTFLEFVNPAQMQKALAASTLHVTSSQSSVKKIGSDGGLDTFDRQLLHVQMIRRKYAGLVNKTIRALSAHRRKFPSHTGADSLKDKVW